MVQEAERVVLEAWPFTDLEFAAFLKAKWWYGRCNTKESYLSSLSKQMSGGINKVALLRCVPAIACKELLDPRIVHAPMYRSVNSEVTRHLRSGVARVHQVRAWLGAHTAVL